MCKFIYFENIRIPSYGLCMAIAMLLCGYLSVIAAKKKGIAIEDTIILLASTVGCALFGASFTYIIVTFPLSEIIQIIASGCFAQLFQGGLVYFGGVIGGIAGGTLCSTFLKANFAALEQSIVPCIPLAHTIGRIGCLLAGCCYGFEYDGVFAVKNPVVSASSTFFPIQAVEAAINLAIYAILLIYSKKNHPPLKVLTLYLSLYSVVRFFTEFFRGDVIRGSFLMFSTSQWISIAILIICILYRFSQNAKKANTAV